MRRGRGAGRSARRARRKRDDTQVPVRPCRSRELCALQEMVDRREVDRRVRRAGEKRARRHASLPWPARTRLRRQGDRCRSRLHARPPRTAPTARRAAAGPPPDLERPEAGRRSSASAGAVEPKEHRGAHRQRSRKRRAGGAQPLQRPDRVTCPAPMDRTREGGRVRDEKLDRRIAVCADPAGVEALEHLRHWKTTSFARLHLDRRALHVAAVGDVRLLGAVPARATCGRRSRNASAAKHAPAVTVSSTSIDRAAASRRTARKIAMRVGSALRNARRMNRTTTPVAPAARSAGTSSTTRRG